MSEHGSEVRHVTCFVSLPPLLSLSPQDLCAVHMHFIDKCFQHIADLTDMAEDSPSRASSGHIMNPDPDLCLQAIERLL